LAYDVVVVGAGPVGSTVARKVAEKGFKTLLCEEHEFAGKPCHCTGKLTAHAFQEFDLPKESILNSVRAAVLHSPSGSSLSIRRAIVDSYILDRELFDSRLAETAHSSGAELSLQTRVHDLHRGSDGLVTLRAKRIGTSTRFRSRLVIDAEGALPILLEKFGLRGKNEFLTGLQYEISDVELGSSDSVELYFGRGIAPGFFAWIVPLSGDVARVGLCIRGPHAALPARDYLGRFLKDHLLALGRIRNGRIEKTYAGVVPIGGPIRRSYTDSVLIVGDSAGQVKSTSGGGIYFGLKAAEAAAETAIECLEKNDTSSRYLRRYQTRWRRSIGRELRVTGIVRRILDELRDAEVDRVFQIVSDENILRIIETYGDTAFQSRLFGPILPKFLRRLIMKPSGTTILAKTLACGFAGLLS